MTTTQDFWNWIPGKRLISEFLVYVFRAMRQEFDRLTMGSTHKTIYQPDAARISVCVPPIIEQRAIVDFLDTQTAKLDTLVAKRRELIEKLKEKRSALISRTVTRGLPPEAARAAGLNPNPKLKPSGIEWLGEIPEHWGICKFSREIRVAEGQVDPEVEPYVSMLLIAPNHIESATGKLLLKETAAEQGAESGKYLCSAGEVIYSKIRPALAKATIAPDDCLCSADMYPLAGSRRFENRYICWLFLSQQFTAWSVLESDRVAMPKINRETLGELRLPVPPISEQRAIADYLDRETSKLDRMVAMVEEAIKRLQEYRTALITAAVTGKIDVRGYRHSTEAA
jgi:type I restriction enzyme S subunit